MNEGDVKINITGLLGAGAEGFYEQQQLPHDNFQCSSICDLEDSQNTQDSYLIISEKSTDPTFGDQYISKRVSFHQLSTSMLSDSVKSSGGVEKNVFQISSSLSSIILDNAKTLSVKTTGSPYIISSIYEKHGEILSVDGYSLSNQISVNPGDFPGGTPIAKIKIGNQTTEIKIPQSGEPETTIISTYDGNLQVIPSKSTRTILKIHVMSDENYDKLSANTKIEVSQGRPVFVANETSALYVHTNELYLTTEDEWEQDPDAVGSILATDYVENEEIPDEGSSETPIEPDNIPMGQSPTTENPGPLDSSVPSDDDQEEDDYSNLVGRDIREFEEVTFLDISLSDEDDEQNTDNLEENNNSTMSVDGTENNGGQQQPENQPLEPDEGGF